MIRCKMTKISLVAAAALLLAAGRSYAAGDPEAGKLVFKKCSICHNVEPGKNKIGPSLFGVVGRESATAPDFNYSEAMKNFKHQWTPEELNTYLSEPRKVVPGTKMIFPGLKDDKERQDVIAYLETLK
jgi:cytochrome c